MNGSIDGLRAVRNGTIGQAHKPFGPSEITLGQNGRVGTIFKTVMTVPVRIIEPERLVEGCFCYCELAEVEKRQAKRPLRLQQQIAVIGQLRPFNQTNAERIRLVELASNDAEHHEAVKRPEEQVMLT